MPQQHNSCANETYEHLGPSELLSTTHEVRVAVATRPGKAVHANQLITLESLAKAM